MADLLWFPAAAKAAGLEVYELPGWETRRTRDGFDPEGVVCHHTATSTAWLDGHVAYLLRDGRVDLAGPLAQFGLERDGTVVLIAAGRCNHNGYGLWGNDSYGIEAYNDGIGERWSAAQLDAYHRLCAALCAHHGWAPATHVKAHRETDPTRKIDPTGIDMNAFRLAVASPPTTKDDDMTPAQEAKLDRLLIVAERLHNATGLDGKTEAETQGNIKGRVDALYLDMIAGGNGADVDLGELVALVQSLPAATVAALKSAL